MHRRDNLKATAIVFVLLAYFFAAPAVFGASASITEIMYDLPGSDTGREWIEIKNVDAAETVFSQWKFFEGNTNHGIILFRGSATSSSGGTAIIADEPEKFLIDWPDFSGTIFKSSFSLSNSGETIALKFDGTVVDEVSYASTTGAAGDGNGLQKSASGWQALPPTPGTADFPAAAAVIGSAADASQTLDEATSTVPDSSETAAPLPPPPPSGGGGGSEPIKPKLFVYAVAPVRTVAGADALFSASSVGVKKEPILNARYLWSFGDGAFAEGEKVLHAYHYPGAYVVLVEASSGEWSATDRKDITVFAPALSIVRIAEGADGFIEVSNGGADDVDVSRWFLQNSQEIFSFPKGTIVKARSAVPFPAAITKIHAVADNAPALLYPNGKVAARYAPPKVESSSSPASLPAEQAVLRSPALPPAPPAEKGSPSLVLVTAAASILKENPVDETGEKDKDKDKDIVSTIVTLPFASTSEILLAAAGSGVRGNSIGKWIAATFVLLSAAVLGYGFLLRAPARETTPAEKLKEEAEKYDLVE